MTDLELARTCYLMRSGFVMTANKYLQRLRTENRKPKVMDLVLQPQLFESPPLILIRK